MQNTTHETLRNNRFRGWLETGASSDTIESNDAVIILVRNDVSNNVVRGNVVNGTTGGPWPQLEIGSDAHGNTLVNNTVGNLLRVNDMASGNDIENNVESYVLEVSSDASDNTLLNNSGSQLQLGWLSKHNQVSDNVANVDISSESMFNVVENNNLNGTGTLGNITLAAASNDTVAYNVVGHNISLIRGVEDTFVIYNNFSVGTILLQEGVEDVLFEGNQGPNAVMAYIGEGVSNAYIIDNTVLTTEYSSDSSIAFEVWAGARGPAPPAALRNSLSLFSRVTEPAHHK